MPQAPVSRRRLLGLAGVGLAGSSAALLAACGGDDTGGGGGGGLGDTTELEPEGTAASRDVVVLNSALDLENLAVAAYKAALPLLSGTALSAGKAFLEHEQEHADALAEAIRQLGGAPNKPSRGYDFPRLNGQRAALSFAADLEETAIAAYIDALPRLTSPDLRGTAAAIVTAEAEHLSVLSGALGRPQTPRAFVTGKA
jgi:rubrerythrin